MELYKELVPLRCFTRNDLIKLSGSENSADWHIRNYLKKGYIERIRRDLYAVISLETGQAIANRFQIASKATDDACVVCHSAFEYYGYANQVFYDVYFCSNKRIRPFEYDGINYCPVSSSVKLPSIDMPARVRVTSLEETVIDSIENMEKAGGLEELLRCLMLVPSLDEEKLLNALSSYEKGNLYQKAGYILETLKDELHLSPSFFNECVSHSSASKTYLSARQDDFVLHEDWKLYAPKNLKSYVDKGVSDYDAV